MIEKNIYPGASATSTMYTDRRDFYISPNETASLWSDATPFLTMVSSMNQKTDLKDPLFKMFEYRGGWKDQRFQVNDVDVLNPTSDAEVTVTLPAASSSNFIGLGSAATSSLVGLVCNVHANSSGPSGERLATVLITTVSDATTIGVKCISTFDGNNYTLVANSWFVVVGNAHGEGSESPEPWADELKTVWGECQIFRTPLQITDTLKKAILRGETKELERLRRIKGSEHKIQKERAMLFGSSVLGTNLNGAGTFGDSSRTDKAGEKVRTTTGIFEAILAYGASTGDDQSIFSIPQATYTYNDFVDATEKVFQYYPEEGVKTMFCGAKMLSYWSKMDGTNGIAGKSKWSIQLSDIKRDRLGFNYRILETPHGIIQLVHAPVLTRSPYNGYGIVVDKSNVFHAIYDNPTYRQNIKTDNAPLYQKDEYYSYEGLGIQLIESHKMFKLT